ncbi:MAG: UDP-N-acetylmuramate dehydrogenase [Rikenellaceae bacterium]
MKHEFYNISLRERNSFGVEQSARRLIEFESEADLVEIFAENPPSEWYVLSGGNNVLFTHDYGGTLLTPVGSNIEVVSSSSFEVKVKVDAGVEWDDFVAWAVDNDYWGVENLSLIPGKVGAAPVQNIGAYGCEVGSVVEHVEMFCPSTLNSLQLQAPHCNFGYRDSIFKGSLRGRVIITSVTFCLSRIARPLLGYGDVVSEVAQRGEVTLRNIREAICAIRSLKLPDTKVMGNAGSFFKNPAVEIAKAEELKTQYPNMPLYPIEGNAEQMKLAAGWLIDQAGFKGYTCGRVGIHAKQALVLVNLGGATGADVVALAHKIIESVEQKFGVTLSPEVNIL